MKTNFENRWIDPGTNGGKPQALPNTAQEKEHTAPEPPQTTPSTPAPPPK